MSRLPLVVAVRAAKAGGRVLLGRLGTLRESEIRKKGQSDWVTQADHASERVIIATIRRAFPDHSIRAEESGISQTESQWEWIIDPLDGTTNFMHRFPMFSVSIGLRYRERLEAGVVYDPLRKDLFTAQRGKGAYLNGKRIHVAKQSRMEDAMLATGFPFRAKHYMDVYLESFRAVFQITGSIRRAGSAALDLAYTACGRLDGFWEMGLLPWDMAAGALLIKEAGGRVTDFFGKDTYMETGNILAGPPVLQKALLKKMFPIFERHRKATGFRAVTLINS